MLPGPCCAKIPGHPSLGLETRGYVVPGVKPKSGTRLAYSQITVLSPGSCSGDLGMHVGIPLNKKEKAFSQLLRPCAAVRNLQRFSLRFFLPPCPVSHYFLHSYCRFSPLFSVFSEYLCMRSTGVYQLLALRNEFCFILLKMQLLFSHLGELYQNWCLSV